MSAVPVSAPVTATFGRIAGNITQYRRQALSPAVRQLVVISTQELRHAGALAQYAEGAVQAIEHQGSSVIALDGPPRGEIFLALAHRADGTQSSATYLGGSKFCGGGTGCERVPSRRVRIRHPPWGETGAGWSRWKLHMALRNVTAYWHGTASDSAGQRPDNGDCGADSGWETAPIFELLARGSYCNAKPEMPH